MQDASDITPISPNSQMSLLSDSGDPSTSATKELTEDFTSFLGDKLNEVEGKQVDAQEKMRLFAAGEIDNVHDVTVAQQKAQMAIRLVTIVRQKLLEAYDRLSQMQ